MRLNVGVMLFMASFTSYMLRVNFSIIIIAMTKKADTGMSEKLMMNETIDGDVHDTFNWSKADQGLLLSAYFYGYIFPNLLGGVLSEKVNQSLVERLGRIGVIRIFNIFSMVADW